MVRVTRSQKVQIAEDQSALPAQIPTTTDSLNTALSELFTTSNTMPSMEEDISVDHELKGLKAAWRIATGGGAKSKKGKSKKKVDAALIQGVAAPAPWSIDPNLKALIATKKLEDEAKDIVEQAKKRQETLELQKVLNDTYVSEQRPPESSRQFSPTSLQKVFQELAVRELTQKLEHEYVTDRQDVNEHKPATGRATRGQVAKQGQSSLAASKADEHVPRRGRDIVSLFGGRSDLRLPLQKVRTDMYLELAGKAANGAAEAQTDTPTSCSAKPNEGEPVVRTLEDVERDCATQDSASTHYAVDDGDDSFVEVIISRSPAKPVSRIEDSLEALDELEEAIAAVDEAALTKRIASPENRRRKAPLNTKAMLREKIIQARNAPEPKSLSAWAPAKSKFATVRVRPAEPKFAVLKRSSSMTFKSPSKTSSPSPTNEQMTAPTTKRFPLKRPASLLPPKLPVIPAKPATIPTNYELPGEIQARKIKEQRDARLARQEEKEETVQISRGGSVRIKSSAVSSLSSRDASLARGGSLRVKSTKPLTKPAFELPGDALSQKKKEALEARLKAQEEEDRKRREFKARPVRNSIVSLPRDTAASRARQSKIGATECSDNSTLTVSQRISMVGAHRPTILELNVMANSSAPRAPGPQTFAERKPSTKSSGPSMSGRAMQRTVSSSDAQAQRQRAKEIYNRDTKAIGDIEKEKREREAAAKLAREEAAERGRQASREWAERQRVKKMVEADKGLSPGYGPGGQLGL